MILGDDLDKLDFEVESPKDDRKLSVDSDRNSSLGGVHQMSPDSNRDKESYDKICISGFKSELVLDDLHKELEIYNVKDVNKITWVDSDGKSIYKYEMSVNDFNSIQDKYKTQFLGQTEISFTFLNENKDRKRKSERQSSESSQGEKKVIFKRAS